MTRSIIAQVQNKNTQGALVATLVSNTTAPSRGIEDIALDPTDVAPWTYPAIQNVSEKLPYSAVRHSQESAPGYMSVSYSSIQTTEPDVRNAVLADWKNTAGSTIEGQGMRNIQDRFVQYQLLKKETAGNEGQQVTQIVAGNYTGPMGEEENGQQKVVGIDDQIITLTDADFERGKALHSSNVDDFEGLTITEVTDQEEKSTEALAADSTKVDLLNDENLDQGSTEKAIVEQRVAEAFEQVYHSSVSVVPESPSSTLGIEQVQKAEAEPEN